MRINLRSLDLNLLRLMVAIWETGSISQAAQQLGMSQPATSNALTRLRKATGDELFVRSKRGMIPTAYAGNILPEIKYHLEGIFETISSHGTFDPLSSNREFRLSLSGLGEYLFLPRLLKAALQQARKIRFDNIQVSSSELGKALQANKVDCAIGLLDVADAGVQSVDLYRDSFVAIAGAALQDTPTSLEDLRTHPLALSAPTSSYAAGMTRFVAKHGLGDSVAVKLANFAVISELLDTSPFVSILPREFAAKLAASGKVRILPIPLEQDFQMVRLVWHARTTHDPACMWLRNLAFELFGKEPGP